MVNSHVRKISGWFNNQKNQLIKWNVVNFLKFIIKRFGVEETAIAEDIYN